MVALAAASRQPEDEERLQDAQHTRVLRGGLPWPAVRGERLLRTFAPTPNPEDDVHPTATKNANADAAPYEIELCVPTAGHVALVLVRRPVAGTTPSVVTRSNTLPPNATVNASTTPAPARVVYVMDAVPPSRKPTAEEVKRGGKSKKGKPIVHQPVDEMDLLEELFSPSSRAGAGKDGSVLAKTPLLCARFECRVVSIRFIRSGGGSGCHTQQQSAKRMSSSGKRLSASASSLSSSTSSTTTSAAHVSSGTAIIAPLRCVVAREDGMGFLWEWQADLHQWIFLNSFCFLENPNLKWTKPVADFTAVDMPFSKIVAGSQASSSSTESSGAGGSPSGATELAWWSTAAKSEPKLCLRVLRFERATDALRATDVIVGSAFSPKLPCADVSCLLSSKLGLFALSQSSGVLFRSAAASLRTVVLGWDVILAGSGAGTDTAAENASKLTPCLHNVTGELILLHRETGAVYLVTPKSRRVVSKGSNCCSDDHDSCGALFTRQMTSLTPWKPSSSADSMADKQQSVEVLDVAAHRHTLVVLTRHEIRVFHLVTGSLLDVVPLPESYQCSTISFKLWTVSGSASAVGLWTPRGLWTIQTPAAKAVGASLHDQQPQASTTSLSGANAAFQAVKDYGPGDLQLDAAKYALEMLERTMPPAMDPTQHHLEAWEAAEHAVSSPALLLALLEGRATPERFVHELGRLVAALYGMSHSIRVAGRLNGSTSSGSDSELPRLTPANLELLHHLSNWILLAKRKLARLEASKDASGDSQPLRASSERPRAESALTRVLANEDDLSVCGADASSPTLAPTPREGRTRNESGVDPEDTRNFRLSRKLRPMSSLRFAAGCSSSSGRQGRQWLAQLEAFLLGAVDFKQENGQGSLVAGATPSHLLFHNERVLADFRHVAASSFSKHMYLESMSRLYLLYEPQSLLPFVRCVERFCPRLFSLSGHRTLARSQAERAMTLFPPIQLFTDRVQHEDCAGDEHEAAMASLLAYVDLLSYCGRHTEACSALLRCNLYEESKQKLLLLLEPSRDEQETQADELSEAIKARASAAEAIYFALLDYCVSERDAADLQALLALKPAHVDVLHVLRALHAALPSSNGKAGGGRAANSGVTVGDLRPVLLTLMQERRAAASMAAK